MFGPSKTIPNSTSATLRCFGLGLKTPFLLFFTNGDVVIWFHKKKISGLLYLGLNQVASSNFPVSGYLENNFASNNYFYKIIYTIIAGRHVLWKYLGVWLLAEGSCVLVGIGYGGGRRKFYFFLLMRLTNLLFFFFFDRSWQVRKSSMEWPLECAALQIWNHYNLGGNNSIL